MKQIVSSAKGWHTLYCKSEIANDSKVSMIVYTEIKYGNVQSMCV